MTSSDLIIPDWPAPNNIKAISTTRHGGVSQYPYTQLNLGTHVGDDPHLVSQNRAHITQSLNLPEEPRWLEQVHGTTIIESQHWQQDIKVDAIFSQQTGHVCAVMTADCLPILLCNQQGDTIAAIHAGWRGLAAGIIEKTIQKFSCEPQEIIAWLGPAIGPSQFEVGLEVYELFVANAPVACEAFKINGPHHYLADIYLLARQRLEKNNVQKVFGGDFCTVSDEERFFSYRRDGITGRMASMIWITDK
jgi:purine-nucleoside/S-methyl-5'-thioadenosine phosphorylase / adenosine deaminase